MSTGTIILRKTITELEKLEEWTDKQLPVLLRDYEIRGFFVARHIKAPKFLIPVQRHAIREWEPRVSNLIHPLKMDEYAKLRNWLGMAEKGFDKVNGSLYSLAKNRLSDYMYQAKVIYDLRNGEIADASSTIRSAKDASTREEG